MDMVSSDVKSLFTNVPIKKTIDVILIGIYNDRTTRTNLKKRLLKKLTLDTGIKTGCSFKSTINDQVSR